MIRIHHKFWKGDVSLSKNHDNMNPQKSFVGCFLQQKEEELVSLVRDNLNPQLEMDENGMFFNPSSTNDTLTGFRSETLARKSIYIKSMMKEANPLYYIVQISDIKGRNVHCYNNKTNLQRDLRSVNFECIVNPEDTTGIGTILEARAIYDDNDPDNSVEIPLFSSIKDPEFGAFHKRSGLASDPFSYFKGISHESYDEFLEQLIQKVSLGEINMSSFSDIHMILWRDEEKISLLGPVDISLEDGNIFCEWTELKTYILSEEKVEGLIFTEPCPEKVFLNVSKYEEYWKNLNEKGIIIKGDEYHMNEITNEVPVVSLPSVVRTERDFLTNFYQLCLDTNLFYASNDLCNFHTAMKTSSLVVLSGMSGTGKTALVHAYVSALGLEEIFIPVSPAWTDDTDLLGYLDISHNIYRPSGTGLAKILVEASQNMDKLYIVCLDEMNLARVEHYFSQFLSILEKDPKTRMLPLYDENYGGLLYNKNDFPPGVRVGENIKFVGTVNVDESTYHFSDKVLDRANVINLEVMNFTGMKLQKKTKISKVTPYSFREYEKFVVGNDPNEIFDEELRKFLWDFHQLLQKTNGKLGVGPRVVFAIEFYLANVPDSTYQNSDQNTEECRVFPYEDALDLQIKQRILTKLRGPEELFGTLLDETSERNTEENPSSIMGLLDKFENLSEFTLCREVIRNKREDLRTYGYSL